jgi:hypothetical protein
MKTIVSRIVDADIIAVIGRRDPTDEDWDSYVRLVNCAGIARAIVYSARGLPSAEQRKRLRRVFVDDDVPIVIVSDSLRVRYFAFLFSVLTHGIRWFPVPALPAALAYVRVPAYRHDWIERELQSLRREVAAG